MLGYRHNLLAFRCFLAVVCLALVAGCKVEVTPAPAGASPERTVEAPLAPAGLVVTPGNAQTSLTWSASSGATSYDVKRSTTSGGPYIQLAVTISPFYTDTAVSNGVTYFYVVVAVNSSGVSAVSAQVPVVPTATPPPAPTIPSVPTGPGATAGNAQVSLIWFASSSATSYHVKRATSSGGPYTQIAVSTLTAFTDTALTNGTPYYYVVSAANSAGESANSTQVSATPQAPVVPPSSPGSLTATAGNAQASLTWSASSGAASYNVKRATASGGPYTQIAAPTATSYADTSLANGTTYYYVVSAINSAGEGANSAQVSATPQAPVVPPLAPGNLTATAGNAQASLTWSASSGATSYNVKRATINGGPYTPIAVSTSTAFTDTPLANGTTYYYVVSAANSAGESANSAQVGATPQAPVVPPSPPGSLTATAGNAQASLTWSASSGATGYKVKRSVTSGGPYTFIAAPTATSYTDTSLANGTTYYYVVSAANSAGEGADSGEVGATPQAPVVPPLAPGNLLATAGNAQASLTWSASSGATSYNVKRAAIDGGPYTPIAVSTSTAFTDTPLINGPTYYYVVSAANSAGEGANSVQVSATPQTPVVPPSPPGNLTATAGNAQASLSWSASSGATSYNVKRATTNGGPYTPIATPTATSYTDTSASNGTTYYYVVSAVNAAGEGADSGQVGATPQSPPPPSPPGNLLATAGNAQVALTWSASSGATSYNVKRATINGGPYTQIQIVVATSTSYTDTSASNGTTYYYVVSAANSVGEGADSVQVSATPQTPVVPPSPPGNLTATAGNAQVGLTWSASSGATSYNVKRATINGGPYTQIATPTATSYTDTSATNGPTYYYVVSAVNSAGEGADSGQVGATPQAPPPPSPPGNLTATAGNAQVGLTWSASSGATSYNVKRATISGGPYTQIQIVVATSTSYTDTSATNGTTYYYVVSAVGSTGEGANSAQVGAIPQAPPPSPPGGLTATAGNAQVGLTWSASSGATSYSVKRATINGGPYTQIATPGSTSYTDTSVTNGTPYYYVVSAVGPTGEGASSGQVSATPLAPPSPPGGLTATAGNAQVGLTWSASTGATGYVVKRSTISGGPYTLIAAPTATSYTDTPLANGTPYYYVVSAVGPTGEGASSGQVSATPLAPPSPPGGLTATAGNAQVGLTWSASSGATSYSVKRATISGGPYTQIATPTATSYIDTSVTNGTPYYYVVSAVGPTGEGASSGQVSATPLAPPSPPGGLTATAGNAQVGLTWSASSGATSYSVKRATINGGPYTQIATPTATSYTDTSVTNGTPYYYVVSAVGPTGEGASSGQVSATPLAPPSPPGGLTATAGNAQVGLTWSASSGATGYVVKRSTISGGPYTLIAAPTATSYTDTPLANGTPYYYVVSAVGPTGEGASSGQVSATPLAPPSPPGGLTATAGNAQVGLTWSASSGATSYSVKRATISGGPYTQIATPTATSYIDTSVTNGTPYYYVVSAVGPTGEGASSGQVSATPLAPPSPPGGLTATAGNAQVGLTWSASSGATSYSVKRATINGGPYTQIATPTATSYTDTSVTNGTPYYYVVSAVGPTGEGASSGQVSATPLAPPSPPGGLTATAGNAQVGLTWSASTGATGYVVKRSTISGGPYTLIAAPTATSYTDTPLANGTPYYYVVSAVGPTGEGASSGQVSATPLAPPSPPGGLTATAGNAQVGLTWSASSGATSYSVKRATISGGPYTQIATPTATSYTDTSVTNGTPYYYVVSAVGPTGEGASSGQVSATPLAPPSPPGGLTATAGNAQVGLTWSASSGATSYSVKRATINGGPYTQIATPSSTSYTDTSATNGTTYYYVVSAVGPTGEGASSGQVSATLPPSPPGNLTATAGNAQVGLTWSASSGATSYSVKRATINGGPYTQIATPSSTSYTDTPLANGTPYYYVVSAVNSGGEGASR